MKKQEINSLIERWLQVGAINQEQATYMIADVVTVTSEKSGHKFISAIMYIGSTGLSLGALLLIASNWAGLSKVIKLILALLLPILPICFAYWQLNVRNESKVLGRAANILGLALVGGSLSLIGQTYNLESNMVTLLWTWALLTTPFVFVFRKKENVLFSAVMIGTALLFSIFNFLENSRMEDGTAVLLVTITGLAYAYLLYAIGTGLRYVTSWADSSRLLRIGAAGLASIILFLMTFGWYAQVIVDHSYRSPGNWEILSFAFNILFIGFLIFALIRSVKFEEYSFAFSIVRLFGLYLLVKYFTLFYSMLDTGIFFIIGGILFITGGWILEKKKDTLVAYMRGSVNNVDNYGQ
jgi:uncharacterized membrane protein